MSTEGIKFLFNRFPVLRNGELALREVTRADAGAIYSIFSDDQVTEYYDLNPMLSQAEAIEMIDLWKVRYADGRAVRWGIDCGSSSGLVGTCGLHIMSEWRGALGYDLHHEYWGRGIMQHALKAVLKFVFGRIELNRVEALVIPGNTRSEKLLSRLGFEREGLLREYAYLKSTHHDLTMFSLLKRDYDRARDYGGHSSGGPDGGSLLP